MSVTANREASSTDRIELPHGYAGDVAVSSGTVWVTWATCETDELSLFAEVNRHWPLRPGVDVETWRQHPPAEMAVYAARLSADGELSSPQQLTAGQSYLQGPVLASSGNQAPWVAWGEYRPDGYALVAWREGRQQIVAASPRPLLLAAAAVDNAGRLCVVWQAWQRPDERTFALYACWLDGEDDHIRASPDPAGEPISVPGESSWSPAVAAAADGSVWCAWESWQGGGSHILLRRATEPGQWEESIAASTDMGLDLEPSLAVDPEGLLWVAWSRSPQWGQVNHSLARARSVHVQVLDPHTGGQAISAGYDETGAAPIPASPLQVESSHYTFEQFIVPMAPRVLAGAQGLRVLYRALHTRGNSVFGWDLRAITHTGDVWSVPVPERLSTGVGFPDTQYGIAEDGDGGLWLGYHACDLPGPRDGGETPPQPPRLVRYHKHAVTNSRFLVERVQPTAGGARTSRVRQRPVVISASEVAPPLAAPVPRDLDFNAHRYHLLFGDLHRHSLYSKCQAANDGAVLDHWRWAVEVAQLDFYALTDHIDFLSQEEWQHTNTAATLMDGNAGVFPLYGFEWTRPSAAGHVNFFYVDADVARDLRVAVLTSPQIGDIWDKLDAWLPSGTVLAIRHHRQQHARPGATDSFASRYEPVIEVMQSRGEAIILAKRFLQAGCRVGFAGASDHSLPGAPFPSCLTGVWAEAQSREGVFEALRQRCTFATNGPKMRVFLSAAGVPMGGEGSVAGTPELHVDVAGTTRVDKGEFFRDGRLIHVEPVAQQQATVTFRDERSRRDTTAYYYVRVVQQAERPSFRPDYGVAYSSPVWLAIA
ncbi:MAG: hypothetical protein CMJ87_08585 [Planctomycetes bacterium]|nr:hypothetical protein [Planctomycetota bacterium]